MPANPQLVRIGPDVKRRTMFIPLESGTPESCAVCSGLFLSRGLSMGVHVCPACKQEAGRLAALGDPRRASA